MSGSSAENHCNMLQTLSEEQSRKTVELEIGFHKMDHTVGHTFHSFCVL